MGHAIGSSSYLLILPLFPQQASCLALWGTLGASLTFLDLLSILLAGSGAGVIPLCVCLEMLLTTERTQASPRVVSFASVPLCLCLRLCLCGVTSWNCNVYSLETWALGRHNGIPWIWRSPESRNSFQALELPRMVRILLLKLEQGPFTWLSR